MHRSVQGASLVVRSSVGPTREVVADAMKRRNVPAMVGMANGRPIVRVALDASGELILARDDGSLIATAPQPVLASLATEWDADVTLDSADFFVSASAREESEPEGPMPQPAARRVYVIGGSTAIDPGHRQNLSAQLEASISVVPAGDCLLLQARGDVQEYWPPAQRPVVAVTLRDDALTVEVYSRAALGASGERAVMRGIPDLTLSWPTWWRAVLAEEGEVGRVQRMLARGQLTPTTLVGGEDQSRIALAELGTDLNAVDVLLDRPNHEGLVDAVAATLGLPREVVELVQGTMTVDDLPGSEHVERTAAGRIVWKQIRRDETPKGWWRRFFPR